MGRPKASTAAESGPSPEKNSQKRTRSRSTASRIPSSTSTPRGPERGALGSAKVPQPSAARAPPQVLAAAFALPSLPFAPLSLPVLPLPSLPLPFEPFPLPPLSMRGAV